ncbi:MAG: hypothetical protein J6125_03910, partial [Clostridia bacterium]|nr:hypothetical protein [Clostridia bacterium]
ADEPFMLFSPGITSHINREVVGVVTGVDKPGAHPDLCDSWLRLCGCRRLFHMDALHGEGVGELLDYLGDGSPARPPDETKIRRSPADPKKTAKKTEKRPNNDQTPVGYKRRTDHKTPAVGLRDRKGQP